MTPEREAEIRDYCATNLYPYLVDVLEALDNERAKVAALRDALLTVESFFVAAIPHADPDKRPMLTMVRQALAALDTP
jgi:hypothetical protein